MAIDQLECARTVYLKILHVKLCILPSATATIKCSTLKNKPAVNMSTDESCCRMYGNAHEVAVCKFKQVELSQTRSRDDSITGACLRDTCIVRHWTDGRTTPAAAS